MLRSLKDTQKPRRHVIIMNPEDERKRRRLYSQSDAHVCFITRLADKRLDLLVGLPHQENTVPLQDLHSCAALLKQTHAGHEQRLIHRTPKEKPFGEVSVHGHQTKSSWRENSSGRRWETKSSDRTELTQTWRRPLKLGFKHCDPVRCPGPVAENQSIYLYLMWQQMLT